MIGSTPRTSSKKINLSIGNVFQAKKNENGEEEKIDLFSLRMNTGYDINRDEFKLSNLNSSLRSSLKNGTNIDINFTHDFYEFDKENKNVSLYSFRHQYACWRLRFGDVPIHLLAKQMGTSVSKIESTYGHIMVLEQADQITKNQEILKRNGVILDKPEVLDDDD